MPELTQRIDANFCQFERDSELRARSLELCSTELSLANGSLNQELEQRDRAIASLKALAQTATGNHELEEHVIGHAADDRNLVALSQAVSALVARLKSEQEEQIKLKEQFDEASAGYQSVLDNLTEVVFRTDSSGRITFINQAWMRTIGLSEDNSLGKKIDAFIDPADAHVWQEKITSLLCGKLSHFGGELRLTRHDGALIWTEVHIKPLQLDSGKISGLTGTFNDITGRKHAANELSQQLAFVDTLFQSLPVPAFVKDANLRYVRFNQAYAELFNIDLKASVGKTTQELGYVTEDATHQYYTQQALNSNKPVVFESHIVLKNQVEMDTMVSKAALRSSDGKVIGLMGTFVNITTQKEMARATEHARRSAEAANRLKSDFLANMSHELRTPMNGIIGLTELMLDTPLDNQQKEYLGLIKQSSDSLMYLLNEILDLSKIEAGKMSLEQIDFNLHTLTTEVMRAITPRINQKSVRIALDIAANVPSQLIGDPGRIRQILSNLLGNAAKFTEQGEIVTRLKLASQQGADVRITIEVSDTGIGISEDQQDRIFAPFVQEDSSITRRFGGTGLGLTITHRLARMMGGHIQLESTLSKGSTFTLEIPLRINFEANENIAKSRTPISLTLNGSRLILIDRMGAQSQIIKAHLESIGCRVSLAQSMNETLELLNSSSTPFDALIVDSVLPHQRGIHLIRDLCNQVDKLPPTFLLTPVSTSTERYEINDSLNITVLVTPASAQDISDVITQTIIRSTPKQFNSLKTDNKTISDLSSGPTSMRAARILLAEDNAVNQLLAKRLLSRWNHHVSIANDGQEALNQFDNHEYDVILMDMQMPFVSGIEACQRIRAIEREQGLRHTIIIALTANAMESDRQRCLDAGMDDYLSKPIHSVDLQRTLEKYLSVQLESPPCSNSIPVQSPHKPFDYNKALQTANPEFIQIIGEAFHLSCPEDALKLENACQENNPIEVHRLAHTLKGLFNCFQAQPAADLAEKLEKLALKEPFDQTASKKTIEALTSEIVLFLPVLQNQFQSKLRQCSF